MKVVIVKEQGTDSLVPLTLSENDSVEMLRQQWSAATGRDSLDYFFKCADCFIEDTQLIGELPSLASSTSCVEVMAERSIQLNLRPYSLMAHNLELKVPLSLEVGLLTGAICNALEVPQRPVDFYRASDPVLTGSGLGQKLSPTQSLGEQGVSENEVLEAVLHVEIHVGTRQLMCAGHVDVASLCDPDFPQEVQRLRYGDTLLSTSGDLLTVLPEALYSPTPIQLTVEWALTVKFRVGDSEAYTEVQAWGQQTAWEVFAASSEIAAKGPSGSQLVLWLAEEEVDPDKRLCDLPGTSPGSTILFTVDKVCNVRVRLTSDLELSMRVRRGARMSHLSGLVANAEEDSSFRLAIEDSDDILPTETTLRQCNLPADCVLRVVRPELDVVVEYEKRPLVSCSVRQESPFPALLEKATKALLLTLDEKSLVEFRCGCGCRVRPNDPKCNSLPPACCRLSPRHLRLCRFLTVRVVKMFAGDTEVLSERFDSTANVSDVQKAIIKHAKVDLGDFEWRLCHKGRLLSTTKALWELEPLREALELELESQIALCASVGHRKGHPDTLTLWLAWPNSTTDSLLAELRTAGLVNRGPQAMLLQGQEVALRGKDGKWVTLWHNGLRSGDEIRIVPEEEVRRSPVKEDGDEHLVEYALKHLAVSASDGGSSFTTVKVICRNWGAPDFETTLPTPVTIHDARQLVADAFQVANHKVFLMQHRAKLPDGTQLIDIGNYRWADINGTIYRDDQCTAFKYNLEKNSEIIPLPGSYRWKLFVRYIAD